MITVIAVLVKFQSGPEQWWQQSPQPSVVLAHYSKDPLFRRSIILKVRIRVRIMVSRIRLRESRVRASGPSEQRTAIPVIGQYDCNSISDVDNTVSIFRS